MQFFHNLSVRRKLLSIILASVVLALILVAAGLLAVDIHQARRAMPRDLNILAQIVGENARAPLAFSDPVFAEETLLASLVAHPRITQAVIYDSEGAPFAKYARSDHPDLPLPVVQANGHAFADGYLNTYHTVFDGEVALGSIFVQSDLKDLKNKITTFVQLTLGVMVVALAGAGMMGFWLQRFITTPVESLAVTASKVVSMSDYSLRATRFAEDELGTLTDTFNGMLLHIQNQSADLDDARVKMETMVNSINGIVWECDAADLRFTYVSQQVEALLGYKPEDWTSQAAFWSSILHPKDAARVEAQCRSFIEQGQPYEYDYRVIDADGRTVWIRESGTITSGREGQRVVRGIFLDITGQKKAETELAELNQKLADSHRMSGMAEVATGVLHNVGNVLNTVNLTADEMRQRIDKSRLGHLRQAVTLVTSQNGNLGEYLESDPRGKALPGFLLKITEHLEEENKSLQTEARSLVEHVEHIKEIVSTQQSYARIGGVIESISPGEIVDAAIKLTRDSYAKHGVEIVKELPDLPAVQVDRHKVVQILVNLLSNGKDAIKESIREFGSTNSRVCIRGSVEDDSSVLITVTDFGIGISPENLPRIFQHGFTTKPSGHGFGLHSSVLAAGEMGGSLTVESAGTRTGTTFTLRLSSMVGEAVV